MMSTSESTTINSIYISVIRWVYIKSISYWTEHLRQLIEAAARERFNDGAALVLRAALKATESRQRSLTEIRSGTFFDHAVNFPSLTD
jgi:hypothetical protein